MMNTFKFRCVALTLGVAALTCSLASPAEDRDWQYSYNDQGQILAVDGPRTDVEDITAFTYNAAGQVVAQINALGQRIQLLDYTASGRPQRLIDANGVVKHLTYHPRGWLTSVTLKDPDGDPQRDATTRYDYDATGQLTQVTLPNGAQLFYDYDAAQRLIAIRNNIGDRIDYTLDRAGNRRQMEVRDASGALHGQRKAVFDELSRLLEDIGANQQETTHEYDANGNLIKTRDALGNGVSRSFDPFDRLVSELDAAQGQTAYVYDDQGRITAVTDPRGITTTYTYNALGDLIQQDSPDTGITRYVHDAAGNVVRQTDARGVVSSFRYDALNRLTEISHPSAADENSTFSYDSTANGNKGVGRLTSYSNNDTTTSFQYDSLGRVSEQLDIIGAAIYSTKYTYDLAGNIAEVRYPSGRIVYYNRDAAGRVTAIDTRENEVSPLVNVVANAAYLPFGPLKSVSHENGVVTRIEYDMNYSPRRISTSSNPEWDFTYEYDLAGNVISLDDQVSVFSKSFSYDALYRIVGDVNDTGSWSFEYDANGNRTRRVYANLNGKSSNQVLTYGSNDGRLTKVGGTAQVRDAVGNLVSYGGRTYTYDSNNRLRSFSVNGNLKVQMLYNARGQRVAKVAIDHPLHQHYDLSGHYLGTTSYKADGTLFQRYEWIYLGDIPVAQVRTNYGTKNKVATRRQLAIHVDHLGTPRAMTDTAQRLVWRWDGSAFGATEPNKNPDGDDVRDILNLRFPGQYFDKETGLHYNYFRDYDPTLGRYLQSDPIGLRGGLNTYAYARGNSLRYTDPFGLDVYIKCRPAQIAFGLIDHCWVETDTKSAGMGANPDIPPGQEYEGYGMPVQITDHSNDSATKSIKMNNVDEQCVNEKLEIGKPIGRFLPPFNHCQSFAYGTVNQCRTGLQIEGH